jgi:hypothetical protein
MLWHLWGLGPERFKAVQVNTTLPLLHREHPGEQHAGRDVTFYSIRIGWLGTMPLRAPEALTARTP